METIVDIQYNKVYNHWHSIVEKPLSDSHSFLLSERKDYNRLQISF